MPFIQISDVYTADPGDVWTRKPTFFPSDPFAIVLIVQMSSDIMQAGLRSNTVFQMVNPRMDPYRGSWWHYDSSVGVIEHETRDAHWKNVPFSFTYFARSWSYSQYLDAVAQINGSEKLEGIFFVRGTIDVIGSDLFAHSGEFWYKVRPR
jgi:hypothetical protein